MAYSNDFRPSGPLLNPRYRKALDPDYGTPIIPTRNEQNVGTPPSIEGDSKNTETPPDIGGNFGSMGAFSASKGGKAAMATAPNLTGPTGASGAGPSIIPALQSQYEDVAGRLKSAIATPYGSPLRSVLGALVSRNNPMLGSVISGQYGYQKALQPLMQEYQTTGDELNRQVQLANMAFTQQHLAAQTAAQLALANYNTERGPLAQQRTAVQAAGKGWRINAQGQPEPIPEEEQTPQAQATLAKTQAQTQDYANKQANFQQKMAFARQQLAETHDWHQAQELFKKLNFGLSQQKFAQQGEALNPAAQNTLMQVAPTKDQVDDLISKFEPTKDDNTPFKHTADRVLYSMGKSTMAGDAADTIAQLELNRVAGAARVMKGSSRSIQALHMAMTHLPNVWTDSDKKIYGQLVNLRDALGQIENDAYLYGKKGGIVPPNPSGLGGGGGTPAAPTGGGAMPSFSDWQRANPKPKAKP